MSGPKISRYSVSPEVLAALAAQRRFEEKRSTAVTSSKRRLAVAKERILALGSGGDLASELARKTGSDGGFSALAKEAENLYSEAELGMDPMGGDCDEAALDELISNFKAVMSKLEDVLAQAKNTTAANKAALADIYASEIGQGFAALAETPADIPAEPEAAPSIKQLRAPMLEQLEMFSADENLPAAERAEIEVAAKRAAEIEDAAFLRNYGAVVVAPLVKRCEEAIASTAEHREAFGVALDEYDSLCQLYNVEARCFEFGKDSLDSLSLEVAKVKAEAVEAAEQAYIASSIDEVMEEMGYPVCGRREYRRRSGERISSSLYTFEEGTAVSVTCSPDGRIAMELGGIDATDRMPDSYEASVLCGQMMDFCAEFREIERRLAEKGVVVASRLSMLPPEEQYAQIINAADYGAESDIARFDAKKGRASAPRARRLASE